MAYIVNQDVKEYMGKNDEDDDAFIDKLIAFATAELNKRTGTIFEGSLASDRNFRQNVASLEIFFDQWTYDVVTVTNGDSDATVLVEDTDYILMPENEGPYYGIEILRDSSAVFQGKVVVESKWFYSSVIPDDLKHIMIRWVEFLLLTRKDPNDELPEWVEAVIEEYSLLYPGATT